MPDDQVTQNPPGPGRCSRLHSVKPLNTSTQHRSRSPSGARPSGTGLPCFLYSRPRAPWQVDVPCGLVGASPQGAGRMSSISALTSAFISVLNRGHRTDDFGREIITMRDAEGANELLSGLTTRPMSQRKDARRSGHPEFTGARQVLLVQQC